MSKALRPLERALKKHFKSIDNALRFFGLRSGGIQWTWHDLARVVSATSEFQLMLSRRGFKLHFDAKAAA